MDEFTRGYIEAAIHDAWDVRNHFGRPFDMDRLAPESLDGLKRDAKRFQREQGALLQQAYAVPGYDPGTAGHDFWHTRNGSGAGFWDGDLPEELGQKLTAAAHAYGSQDLYVGDDGKVYATGAEQWVNEGGAREVTRASNVAQDFPSPEDAMHHAAHVGFTHFTHVGKAITLYGPGPDGMSARARLFYAKGKYHISKPGLTRKPIPKRAHVIEHEEHHHEQSGPRPTGHHHSHASAAHPPEEREFYYVIVDQKVAAGPFQNYGEAETEAHNRGGAVTYGVPAQYRSEDEPQPRSRYYPTEARAPHGAPAPDHEVLIERTHRGVVYRVYKEVDQTTCAVVIAGADGRGWHIEGRPSPEDAEAAAKAAIDAYPSHYGAHGGTTDAREAARLYEKGLVWLHRPDGVYWANATGGTYWLVPTPGGGYSVTWSGSDGSSEDLGVHPLASAYQIAGRHEPARVGRQVAEASAQAPLAEIHRQGELAGSQHAINWLLRNSPGLEELESAYVTAERSIRDVAVRAGRDKYGFHGKVAERRVEAYADGYVEAWKKELAREMGRQRGESTESYSAPEPRLPHRSGVRPRRHHRGAERIGP